MIVLFMEHYLCRHATAIALILIMILIRNKTTQKACTVYKHCTVQCTNHYVILADSNVVLSIDYIFSVGPNLKSKIPRR